MFVLLCSHIWAVQVSMRPRFPGITVVILFSRNAVCGLKLPHCCKNRYSITIPKPQIVKHTDSVFICMRSFPQWKVVTTENQWDQSTSKNQTHKSSISFYMTINYVDSLCVSCLAMWDCDTGIYAPWHLNCRRYFQCVCVDKNRDKQKIQRQDMIRLCNLVKSILSVCVCQTP